MRILVVEDEVKVASFIRRALEEESYAVDVCGDGAKGLDLAQAAERGRGDGAGERAVALGEAREQPVAGAASEGGIQRLAVGEHRIEQRDGGLAGGQPDAVVAARPVVLSAGLGARRAHRAIIGGRAARVMLRDARYAHLPIMGEESTGMVLLVMPGLVPGIHNRLGRGLAPGRGWAPGIAETS